MNGSVLLVGVDRWGYPSLGAVYLRNWAHRDPELKRQVPIGLLEVPYGEPAASAARAIAARKPALAGFSCFLWNVGRIFEIARALKRAEPGILIALGGPEIGPRARRALAEHPEIDFVVCGEGEESFRLLLRSVMLRDIPLARVPGLAYRDGERAAQTDAPALIDLAEMPLPYSEAGAPVDAPRALLESSRGCPFTCTFCDWGPRKMRYLTVPRLEKEFRALAPKAGWIHLCDADVLMDKERGAAILQAFLRASEGAACTLKFDTNPTYLRPEIADIVARDPAKFSITLGVQTTNEDALKRVHRVFDRAKVEANLRYLRKAAPAARILFSNIFGLPGDDLEGLRRTLDWILRWRPYHAWGSQLLMIPGADIVEEAASFGARYQAEPPYQTFETGTMSREEVGRARELTFHLGVLYSLSPSGEALWGGVDLAGLPDGARIGLLEGWIERLRRRGLDPAFGMPVATTDELRVEDRVSMALERLKSDQLLVASLMRETRRFSAEFARPAEKAVYLGR